MSGLNVYGWIRDSVRRAVLLGYSDAVEQLGVLEGNQNIHPQLLAMLKQNPATEVSGTTAPAEAEAAKPRRRLGRSLDEISSERGK